MENRRRSPETGSFSSQKSFTSPKDRSSLRYGHKAIMARILEIAGWAILFKDIVKPVLPKVLTHSNREDRLPGVQHLQSYGGLQMTFKYLLNCRSLTENFEEECFRTRLRHRHCPLPAVCVRLSSEQFSTGSEALDFSICAPVPVWLGLKRSRAE